MNTKIIPNYPNYSITELGEVRNIKRDKILKQRIIPNGYKIVEISKDGLKKTYFMHRLLYECFVLKEGDINPECVDHKDNNKLNNALINLRPATRQENCRNCVIHKNKQLTHKNIYITKWNNYQVIINTGNGKPGNGKIYHKTHKTLELAIADRNEKLILFHGEFANTGIINSQI